MDEREGRGLSAVCAGLWWLWYDLAMNDGDDKRHVGEAVRRLCAVHRVKHGTDISAGIWAGLRDLSRADFDRALAHVEKYSKWMPTPATFRAALRQGWL